MRLSHSSNESSTDRLFATNSADAWLLANLSTVATSSPFLAHVISPMLSNNFNKSVSCLSTRRCHHFSLATFKPQQTFKIMKLIWLCVAVSSLSDQMCSTFSVFKINVTSCWSSALKVNGRQMPKPKCLLFTLQQSRRFYCSIERFFRDGCRKITASQWRLQIVYYIHYCC